MFPTADGRKIEIIKTVSPYWMDVGDLLDFDALGTKLEQIKADEGARGVESCTRAMFRYWLEGNGVQPATWTTLLKVLRNTRFTALAAQLEKGLLENAQV